MEHAPNSRYVHSGMLQNAREYGTSHKTLVIYNSIEEHCPIAVKNFISRVDARFTFVTHR